MRKWLTRREDPHAVYNRILPHIEELDKALIITRWGNDLTSHLYIIRILLAIAGDLVSVLRCCQSKAQHLVVREFSAWPWLLLGPVIRIFNIKTVIYLNINHNLNNAVEAKFLLPALSKLFSIAFIEPSESLLAKHPYLTPLRLALRPGTQGKQITSTYLFLGTRTEQICVDDLELASVLHQWPKGVKFLVCGGANNSRLPSGAFLSAFSSGALIAVLYRPEAYSERHSGVALEALVGGCPLVMFNSTLAQSYIQRGFPVYIINTVSKLPSIIRSLNANAS